MTHQDTVIYLMRIFLDFKQTGRPAPSRSSYPAPRPVHLLGKADGFRSRGETNSRFPSPYHPRLSGVSPGQA
jgi:hypothetical protein